MGMTGYTAAIVEDKGQTFREFVLDCSKAMWAGQWGLATDRQPDTYHKDELAKAVSELEVWSTFPDDLRDERYEQERREYEERISKADDESFLVRSRLEEMWEKVSEWQISSPDLQPLKAFMLEQLKLTLVSNRPWTTPWPHADAEAWLDAKINRALKDVEYHRTQYAEERKRVAAANKWAADLLASLEDSTD